MSSPIKRSHCDQFWTKVINFFSVSDESQVNISWRFADDNKTECSHCVVSGGGPIIKCSADRCKREYHIECGFKRGGFYVDNIESHDNMKELTFFCEVHHKPPLFCVCQQPYDATKEMVCCDECIEWFHISCVGISSKTAATMDTYICPKCIQLHREHRTVSTQEKERNEKKEHRSTCQQNANKSFRILVEIAESVCPLIDQLHRIGNHDFSLSHFKEIEQYLNSDIFSFLFTLKTQSQSQQQQNVIDLDIMNTDETVTIPSTTASSSSSSTSATSSDSSIDFYGTEYMIIQWHNEIKSYIQSYQQYELSLETLKSTSKSFLTTHSLSIDYSQELLNYITSIKTLISALKEVTICSDDQLSVNYLDFYVDTLTNYHTLLQHIHADNQQHQIWWKTIEFTFKSIHPRIRRLQQLYDQMSYKKLYQILHQNYIQQFTYTTRIMDTIYTWIQDAESVIQGRMVEDTLVTVEDIVTMIKEAQDFPIQLHLIHQLQRMVQETEALDKEIQTYLHGEDISEETYNRYDIKVNESQIKITHLETFQQIGERINFLSNYTLMTSVSQRIPYTTIVQLQELCEDILKQSPIQTQSHINNKQQCKLIYLLNERISTCQQELNTYLQSTLKVKEEGKNVIQNISILFDASIALTNEMKLFLSKLETLRVITIEEYIILFIQSYIELHTRFISIKEQANKANNANNAVEFNVKCSLEEGSQVRKDLEQLVNTAHICEEYPVYTQIKQMASSILNELIEIEEESIGEWQELSECIEHFQEDSVVNSVNLDDYQDVVNQVQSSMLVDKVILEKWQQFEQTIHHFIEECSKKIPLITSIEPNIDLITDLYTRSKHLPLPECISNVINERYHVCAITSECQHILHTHQKQDTSLSTPSIVNTTDSSSMNIVDENRDISVKLADLLDIRKKYQHLMDIHKNVMKSINTIDMLSQDDISLQWDPTIHSQVNRQILDTIWDTFRTFYWKQEMYSIHTQPISKLQADVLVELGKSIHAELHLPLLWNQLHTMTLTFEETSKEIIAILNTMDVAMKETNEVIYKLIPHVADASTTPSGSIITIGDSLTTATATLLSPANVASTVSSEQYLITFMNGMKTWKLHTKGLLFTIEEISKKLDTHCIIDPNLNQKVTEAKTILYKIEIISKKVTDIYLIMYRTQHHDSTTTTSGNTDSTLHTMEFKELTVLVNEFRQFMDQYASFQLMSLIYHMLYDFYHHATKWNETATLLYPTKLTSTRKKNKSSTITYTDFIHLSRQPVCHAIKLPMYETIMRTITETEILKKQVVELFKSITNLEKSASAITSSSSSSSRSSSGSTSTSNMGKSKEIIDVDSLDKTLTSSTTSTDTTTSSSNSSSGTSIVSDNIHPFDIHGSIIDTDNILHIIIHIQNTLVKLEALPFELVESKVAQWYLSILIWLSKLPLSYVQFAHFVVNATDTTNEIYQKQVLTYKHIISLEHVTYYADSGHQLINSMSDVIENWFYDQHILIQDDTEGGTYFQEDVTSYLYRTQEIVDHLKDLKTSYTELCTKIRSNVLNTTISTTLDQIHDLNAKLTSSPIIPENDIKKLLEHTIAQYYLHVDKVSTTTTTTASKRSKGDDTSVPPLVVPPTKKKVTKPRCMNKGCTHAIQLDSLYCSGKCMIQQYPQVLHDLLHYKHLLVSHATVPSTILSKYPILNEIILQDRQYFQLYDLNMMEISTTMNQELCRRKLIEHSKEYEEKKKKNTISEESNNNINSSSMDMDSNEPSSPHYWTDNETVTSETTMSIKEDKSVEKKDMLEQLLIDSERYYHRIQIESGQLHSSISSSTTRSDDINIATSSSSSSSSSSSNSTSTSDKLSLDNPTSTTSSSGSSYNTTTNNNSGICLYNLPPSLYTWLHRSTGSQSESPRSLPSPSNKPPSATSSSGEQEIRKTVKSLFEDIFIQALCRQHVDGAISLGAILAIDVEHELYLKYYTNTTSTTSSSSSSGGGTSGIGSSSGNTMTKEFNRKEYRTHQIMLYRNLKQTHNDHLIVRLAKLEVSVDTLLNMTAQQLADTSTQTLRAKQIDNALKDSHMKQSIQDTLEAKCRLTMAGHETWRNKDTTTDTTTITPLTLPNMDTLPKLSVEDTVKAISPSGRTSALTSPRKTMGGTFNTSGSSYNSYNSNSSIQLEHIVTSSSIDDMDIITSDDNRSTSTTSSDLQRKPKRPLNVDNATRYTTDRPKKKRDSFETEPIMTGTSVTAIDKEDYASSLSSSSSSFSSKDTVKTKTPNVLEMLKANINTEKKLQTSQQIMKMISSTGSTVFTISKPGLPSIECVGCISDRRMLGLVKNSISIDGRTRIAELETFINQVLTSSRKTVTVFRLYTYKSTTTSPSSALISLNGYRKFCDEFTRDSRAGLCNITKQLQVYIIPPGLRSLLSILKDDVITTGLDRVLYGIIITKEVGPIEMTSGPVEYVDYENPPEPTTTTTTTSSMTTTASIVGTSTPGTTTTTSAITSVIGNKDQHVSSVSSSGNTLITSSSNVTPSRSVPTMTANANVKEVLSKEDSKPLLPTPTNTVVSTTDKSLSTTTPSTSISGHPTTTTLQSTPAVIPVVTQVPSPSQSHLTQQVTRNIIPAQPLNLNVRASANTSTVISSAQVTSSHPSTLITSTSSSTTTPTPDTTSPVMAPTTTTTTTTTTSIAPVQTTATSTTTSAPPAAAAPTATTKVTPAMSRDTLIRATAKFCSEQGPSAVLMMRNRPDAKIRVPFVFEQEVGYEQFMNNLHRYTYPNDPTLPYPNQSL